MSNRKFSKRVYNRLRKEGEIRVNDFTEERVAVLSEEINDNYEEGVGISGTKFSRIIYNYIQPLNKYEGIAYHMFGLVATRPVGKQSPLFLVRIEDAGKTAFPVCQSKYHSYDKISSIRNSVNELSWSGEDTKTSKESTKAQSLGVSRFDFMTSSEAMSNILSTLSGICDYLSKLVNRDKVSL